MNTKEELIHLVSQSRSFSEVLRLQGKAVAGNSARALKRDIENLEIDTSHFVGYGGTRGLKFSRMTKDRFLSQLIPNTPLQSSKIRLYLLRFEVKEHQCSRCQETQWMDAPIPLQLDHIDGDRNNSVLENLRLLCPNCHAQTETWGTKRRRLPERKCPDCGKIISRKSMRCGVCAVKAKPQPSKTVWPNSFDLRVLIGNLGFSGAGRELGVSDNAVRKHLKSHA